MPFWESKITENQKVSTGIKTILKNVDFFDILMILFLFFESFFFKICYRFA